MAESEASERAMLQIVTRHLWEAGKVQKFAVVVQKHVVAAWRGGWACKDTMHTTRATRPSLRVINAWRAFESYAQYHAFLVPHLRRRHVFV